MPSSRSPRLSPTLVPLESRDVPAVFYVDPLFAGKANGTVMTFNADGPGAVTGRTIGTDAFATLGAALTAAAANAESDTINLARSRFDAGGGSLLPNVTPVDNTGGPIVINDIITLVGSGRGATVLAPTTNTATSGTGVFGVAAGKALSVRDLTFDGGGKQVGIGFSVNAAGALGTFARVEVTGVAFGPVDGTGLAAGSRAKLNVTDSQVSGYGRIGISYADATGSVVGTTVTGKGAGTTFINYGLQIAGSAAVVVTGNTITGNTATTAVGELSAGVNLFEFGGAAPTATLTKNTITGNTFGVRVGGDFGVDRSLASIRSNNLNGNFLAIQADNVVTVDAVNNWYGDASGPFVVGTNPNGKGSEVTDQVNFAPFLTAPFATTTTVPGPVQVVTVPGPVQVVTVAAPPAAAGTPPPSGLAVGGSGQLTGLNGTLASALSARPFGLGYGGEVRVARADVTGDGVADYVTAAGPGGGPRVLVFDGASGAIIRDFYAYTTQFTGGVFVAGGDIDGDGFADIVTGAGGSGSTHVKAFSGRDGSLLRSFNVYPSQYIGGATVAAGDVNGDGFADIVTGTTVGGGPNVRVFDGQTNALRNSFVVGDPAFTGGIRVGAQDLDSDGRDDLLFGLGSGGDNRARVAYAVNLAQGNFNPTAFTQPLFGTADGLFVG